MKLQPSDFRKIFRFSFEGEPALDAGGVAREWYEQITKTLFDLNFGLFCGSSDNQALYQINRNSGIANPHHLLYFRFAGRLMAKALFDGQLIKPHLVRPFYKHIIGTRQCLPRITAWVVHPILVRCKLWLPHRMQACRYVWGTRSTSTANCTTGIGGLIAACCLLALAYGHSAG